MAALLEVIFQILNFDF